MFKKSLKVLLVTAATLLALIVIILAVSLRLVDSKPYRQTKYYKNSSSRIIEALASSSQPAPARLYGGVGKAGLTPPVGVPLAGYGARKGAPSTGVHDSLFVRVLALQSGAQDAYIVGYDALLLHPPVARQLEQKIVEQLHLDPDRFLYTATHTHSGPGGWGQNWFEEQFAGPPDPVVVAVFIDSTIAAIRRAVADRQPAAYSVGAVQAPRFIRNRLVGDKGQVDAELVYAIFQSNDNPIGVFASYSAHATVLSSHNMQMSGDYPGYFERKIESELGGEAIFAAAGLGSHSYRGEGEGFAKAAFVGEGLADSLLAHRHKNAFRSHASLRTFRIPVDLARLQVRLTQKICLAPWLAKRLLHPYESYVQVVALDNFVIIGSTGEFSGELALDVKAEAAKLGKKVTVVSFNGCYIGYLTPSQYYSLPEYETKLMSWFGPYTGDYLADLMKQIIRHL